jgi:electron transfer flavoprotein alpha subunit
LAPTAWSCKHAAFHAPEGCASTVTAFAKAGKHAAVLFPASATGRDLAPRVAAQLGVPLAGEITDLGWEGGAVVATRPVYAGKALLKIKITASPAVLSLRPSVFTPVERPRAGTVESPSLASAEGGRVVVR